MPVAVVHGASDGLGWDCGGGAGWPGGGVGYVLYVEPWNGSLNVSFSHVRVEGKKGGYQERGQSEEGDGMEVRGENAP